MVKLERIKSGIPGLEEITGGGIPRNQLVLLTGTSGTGKTTLCTQYIYEGAKMGENGVFLSFEDPAEYIKDNAKLFGWDLETLEKARKFEIIRYDPYRISDVMDILESTIRDIDAKRVVIDSVSALGLYVRDKAELRRIIFDMALRLRKLDCTAILTSEIVHGTKGISRYGVEEFIADSAIVLYYEKVVSAFIRAIQVWKLRGSNHSKTIHPYIITDKGVTISPGEEAFMQTI